MSHQNDHAGSHIAVVGMGCRLPGDIDSPAALWRLLVDGRDAVGHPLPSRALPQAPDSPAHAMPRWGGYLRDVAGFDADFFGVSGKEAEVLDPQHRLLLEVAWEALEHAGIAPDRLGGTATGLFAGLSYTDYMESLAGAPRELEGSILTNGHCVAAGRISYLLGLQGPCVALDTACSSSLVALHLACQSLRDGECNLALAGGVTLMLGARTTLSFARMGMLSPTGRCHTFDAAADGFVRGEGSGVVVLKRLHDALREGDRILAVVRGSAVNQDGRSDGLAAPSASAQQALFRQALARAETDPRDVGMIETHGTGTPVGDPIEFSSVAEVYGVGQGRCALGSVKTNVGHLEPAAGVVGLIKAVLCLQHGLVPPNLHFTRWNPDIDAEGTRLFVPTSLSPWPTQSASRLAAVSSFGFSGTNAHVILEQAPTPAAPACAVLSTGPADLATTGDRARIPAQRSADQRTAARRHAGPDVILVPAGSQDALPAAAKRFAHWVATDGADVPLRDIAHTLALRRSLGRGRLGVVATSHNELIRALRAFEGGHAHPGVVHGAVGAGISRHPVWVFSGQGSQWQGMGQIFLQQDPAFAEALTEADALIAAEAGFSVLDAVRAADRLDGCARVQPALFALQVALAATWRAHGVQPAAVIGHSMGEVAAAVTAGALSLADGVRVICRRSALLTRIAGAGAMATVALDSDAVQSELTALGATDSVSVAVIAAPGSTVVAGTTAAVRQLIANWQARGVPAHAIAVDVASHCPQVDPLLADLSAALADLTPHEPAIPFYTTVLDNPRDTPLFDAAYWCANLRRPVRFAAAVAAAATDRHQVYIEVSPQPVVTLAIAQNLSGLLHHPVVLPTLRRREDEQATFRTQLAALHCAGVDVDWAHLYADGNLADVPPLTFDRRPHWADTAQLPAGSRGSNDSQGTLPGRHTVVPGSQLRHSWQADVGIDAIAWMADHRVHGSAVLPGAAYCALALTAACEVFGATPYEVEALDIHFLELMQLAEHTPLSTTVTRLGTDRADCEIFGPGEDGTWVRQARAVLRRAATPAPAPQVSVAELAARHPVALDPDALYASLRARGLQHGPAFNGITDLHASAGNDSFWARVAVPVAARTTPHALHIHPVLLDLCAQLVVAGLIQEPGHGLVLPVHVKAVRILGDPETAVYAHARLTPADADGIIGHVVLLDEGGNPVVDIESLRFVRHGAPSRDADVDRWFLEPHWQPSPRSRTPQTAPGHWLVIGESDGSATALAQALRAEGATADTLDAEVGADRLESLRNSLTRDWSEPFEPPQAVVLLCAPPTGQRDPGTDALRRVRRLLAIAQAAATHAEPPRLYAVTRCAQSLDAGRPTDLGQSALRGLVRVLTQEHPTLRATLIDTGATDPDLIAAARELLCAAPEDEVLLRDGERHVAHLAYAPLSEGERTAATTRTVRYGVDRFQLRAGRLGDLDALGLVVTPRRAPGPGEVEVRVQAAGVNFRDVLTSMGLLATDEGAGYRIGFECTGLVTAVGAGVETVRAGDTVLAVDLRGGAFSTFVTVPAAAVAPVPEGIATEAAAGLPTAFLTAWYALRHIGGLTAGERVLIHSATGGTGLAAVAVATRLGAEVLATAGSDDKRRYLRDMGIRHVMDSRSLDFAEQTRAATGGEGVDVVLNSLSGQAIRAGMETLRPFGRFVELGVRDILADTPLGLAPLRHNVSLSAVDLIELQSTRPDTFAAVMREVLAEFGQGTLTPLPYRTYALDQAADALRLMAGAGHIGKLILTVPQKGDTTAVLREAPPAVRKDGAYLITGGLRGVGLATACWLARQGARHLVLNGRTRPSPAAEQTLTQLREQGTQVTVLLGDIAERGTAERLVGAATADGRLLRGVIHAAMVLDDAVVTNITDDQLERVWRPKATGAWRLHEATSALDLDWFVLYSSMASLLGNPGQGAYAAANAWLDALATWRSARGLRTLAVNWGPWGEVGVATDFAARGYQTIPTAQGLQALAALLTHRRVRTGVIPGEPDSWIPAAGRHSSLFAGFTDGGPAGGARQGSDRDIQAELRSTEAGLARHTALEKYLAEHIRTVLRLGGTTLDPQTPLKALGFDSLLRIELRTRLESALHTRLSSDFVWQHPTLSALATGLAEHLGLSLSGGDGPQLSRAAAAADRADAGPGRDGPSDTTTYDTRPTPTIP
ncbi:acyl transferase domain-containing protein/NADPH:quinone reductase-like Zn-dependent oxidoreductase/acyl carrier protein [Kitasatospora sp. MAP12-15]|uniref:type I polyketide synthase n=1 Tax=unclassified Kitasatospora TaxID=2633591 RepID=UPI0024769181|nr:type I polyketide synthase [Kitasatospora sp. MAP12-44]MDH6107809.1 acyl transferase domain-containing protein/NADPH:quinone reductase-like Zn-dependent oxidoreductase/acyl carrier protein [Kitasatospora sp. MAP12-44]